MTEPTYRDNLRASTRDIAHKILTTNGLVELQARKVATAANCSVGTLYNIWRNLDELIIAANAVTLGQLGSTLTLAREATQPETTLHERLLVLAGAYTRFAIENQNAWRSLFDHRMAKGHAVPEWYRGSQSELFAIVETVLAPFVTDTTDRARAARALFASVHGIITLALDEKLGNFNQHETEAQVRFIVTAAAQGLEHSVKAHNTANERQPGSTERL